MCSRFEGGVAFVWFAGAALLSRLLMLRPQHWLGPLTWCAASGAISTALFGLGPAAAVPMLLPNLAEPMIAAFIVRRYSGGGTSFTTHARLLVFLAAAGLVAPAATAFLGAGIASTFGSGGYWDNWLHWFTGHALGTVTFTPVAHYIARGGAAKWIRGASKAQVVETVALVALVAGVSLACFAQRSLPLLFLPILPINLAMFRGGRLPAVVSILVLTVVAGAFTASGQGPMGLIDASSGARIMFLQFYLAVAVLTILPMVTELGRRRDLFRQLRESEARYRLLTENSTDIILNLEVDGTIRFASPSVTQIGGYAVSQLLGRNATELVDPEDLEPVRETHRIALADPSRTFIVEYRAALGDGSIRWFESHTRAVLDGAMVVGAVCAVRDVTHRKALEDRLSHAASTDPLTGLANRRAFEKELKAQIEAGETGGCIAVFDLDHFKRINDRFGHPSGDAVLKSFAQQAQHCVREGDILARVGGEEFAVILPGASLLQAQRVCERLRRSVAAMKIDVENETVTVTVSGGVAPYTAASAPEALLADADAALYEAKAQGRDQLAFAA